MPPSFDDSFWGCGQCHQRQAHAGDFGLSLLLNEGMNEWKVFIVMSRWKKALEFLLLLACCQTSQGCLQGICNSTVASEQNSSFIKINFLSISLACCWAWKPCHKLRQNLISFGKPKSFHHLKMLGPPSRLESTKMLREVLEITNQKLIDSDHWGIGIQRGAVLCREFRTEINQLQMTQLNPDVVFWCTNFQMTCACLQTLVCNSDLFMLVYIYIYVFCLDTKYTTYFFRGTVAN